MRIETHSGCIAKKKKKLERQKIARFFGSSVQLGL